MGRKRTFEKKPFESNCSKSDTSANIYMSMMLSDAYKLLTPSQKSLYTCCKAQYYREGGGKTDRFTMNQSKWQGLYGLYKKGNEKGFYRDMDRLIELGFIACVSCGASSRRKTVYRYSSMWQHYGTDAFVVLPSDMTVSLARKINKKT